MNGAVQRSGHQGGISPDVAQRKVHTIPVEELAAAMPLRLEGVNRAHARILAESAERLPPILVHRHTMRVIDGVHRLFVAKVLGRETIEVEFFDGDEDEAFLQSVHINVRHGLPLTLADRRVAATRIVCSHADWSDRRIAGLVGLSPKTVGAVRAGLSQQIPQLSSRVGRDGRIRRLVERKPLHNAPSAPMPADAGHLAPAPAHPEAGASASPDGSSGPSSSAYPRPAAHPTPAAAATENRRVSDPPPSAMGVEPASVRHTMIYRALCQDPSFRMTESGRFFLRLLDLHLLQTREWERLVANVPPHRATSVAEIARECAHTWQEFADQVSHLGPDFS